MRIKVTVLLSVFMLLVAGVMNGANMPDSFEDALEQSGKMKARYEV